jgi:hypothetical protein
MVIPNFLFFGTTVYISRLVLLATLLSILFIQGVSHATEPGISVQLELGAAFQQKNDVRIPNNLPSNRFSLQQLAGDGEWLTARINWQWNINEKHGVRAVLSPFSYSETGILASDVNFIGEEYSSAEAVAVRYRFNSWRLGYRYNFHRSEDWQLWIGGTLKVRDAEIQLRQGSTGSLDDNVGVVPLVYFAADYRFSQDWLFQLDFDGLAGGPGRAFDVSARMTYESNQNWRAGVGFRGLEGGVDNDEVYNFAWFNTVFVSLEYRFNN